ncbi:hypothetical protein [Winogradskyella aquimaris]|uniref:Uncharacterized protein n=1 Tax=Winogradskyella aquimaris TaxID=864074 RepID=A0ABU5ESI2_9FLAO|nr:hypothetical protein [Winogradskyella aquimaris]MDY2588515.1 hypothetical protein [Winogradskyella aquimaris]
MKQESIFSNLTAKVFFIAMGILFILLQIAFHPTYLQYFPKFEEFTWTHHIHGALMVSWVIMLVVQPYLIYKGKYKAHRLIGKISYGSAPLVIISMFLITKLSYLKTVNVMPFEEVAAIQSLNFVTPLNFLLFYSLAIFYRKNVFKHKRYMIGTAFTISAAIFNRLLYAIFGESIGFYAFFIAEYFGAIILMLLLLNDLKNKVNTRPYTIVAIGLSINLFVIHSRNTEIWQTVVRFVGDTLF